MCVICTGEYKKPDWIKNRPRPAMILRVSEEIVITCENVTEIPNMPGVSTLVLNNCEKLKKVSVFPGLKNLRICFCWNVEEIAVNGTDLKKLFCYDCPMLKKIPKIPGLEKLFLEHCPAEEIPVIPGLEELVLRFYPIKEIPDIPGLIELDCHDCRFLEKIPLISSLQTLFVSRCDVLTQAECANRHNLTILECPWIDKKKLRGICTVQLRVKFLMKKRAKKLPYFTKNIEQILEKY
jgi:hypothetical protein